MSRRDEWFPVFSGFSGNPPNGPGFTLSTIMLRVTNPYDDEIVCELPHDEGRGLEEKVALARDTFSHWRRLPLGERVARIRASA